MFRLMHTLTCLTVLSTALPQGWCCWLIQTNCCADSSVSVHSSAAHLDSFGSGSFEIPANLSETPATCGHCCSAHKSGHTKEHRNQQLVQQRVPMQQASQQIAGNVLQTDSVNADSNDSSIPNPDSIPNKECCQSAPRIPTTADKSLVNPPVIAWIDFEVVTKTLQTAIPFDSDSPAPLSSNRRHAQLCRWVC